MIFVDMLGMEMHTNTWVRVFVGRRRARGWDGEPRLRLTIAVAESYRNIGYRSWIFAFLSTAVIRFLQFVRCSFKPWHWLHHIYITSHAFKNNSLPLQIRPFSRWPPKNKMADNSLGSVCGKLVISQFLVIVEHQNWYQIKATALFVIIQFKYAN